MQGRTVNFQDAQTLISEFSMRAFSFLLGRNLKNFWQPGKTLISL